MSPGEPRSARSRRLSSTKQAGPSLAIADGFAQLVAHVLAHVPLEQAGNLNDHRYVAWTRGRVDAAELELLELLEHDAALLARCWQSDRSLDLLHGFFDLHRSLAAFLATRGLALAQVEAGQVCDPQLLDALRGVPAAELLHATLALLAPRFDATLSELEPLLSRALEQLQPWTRRVAALLPSFAGAHVELVWALGQHGRALDQRILVGAPSAWSGCSPARQAVLAAHEHLVARVEAADHVEREWVALIKLTSCMRAGCSGHSIHSAHSGHLDYGLREAHCQWLAQLDLSALLAELRARAWVSADEADMLERDVAGRASRLAALDHRRS